MANETFVFDAKGLAVIKEVARQVLGESRGSPLQQQYRGRVSYSSIVAKVKSPGITARSGDTPGEGEVILNRRDPSGNTSPADLVVVKDANNADVVFDVYNTGGPIAQDEWVTCEVDRFGSLWVTAGLQLYRFALTGGWTSNAAPADIKYPDGTTTSVTDDVQDPLAIFSSTSSGHEGWCLYWGGKYYVIQMECP